MASVSGLFATVKCRHNFPYFSTNTAGFPYCSPFPNWQSIDLFLSLFSGPRQQLFWEVDDLTEFVKISSFFLW